MTSMFCFSFWIFTQAAMSTIIIIQTFFQLGVKVILFQSNKAVLNYNKNPSLCTGTLDHKL